MPALALLEGHVDALITTMLATGGSGAGDNSAEAGEGVGETWQDWDATALAALDVPVIQAVCSTSSRATWLESDSGLTPLDAATQVAIPEFDGRLLGGVISFKERDAGASPVGVPVPRYVADPERCARVAGLAVNHARLRHLPASERRVAMLLTAFPTKHAKIGMAVGLDTPASAIELLATLREDGMRVEHDFADGDALMHALIATGGHDPEFLTADQLAAAPLRLPVADYLDWYATLPADLREAIEGRWGPAPGDRYVDGDDLVVAGLELGNVVVAIQPPRGYGEDPVGIYHDPLLPPTHHYLACYRWIQARWGAHAIVHLGKHGTLEWTPGKMLALSESCAPDAALGSLPLVYPFVVNDPGEGVQAKRRAHATIVDHLVPPMMRADTYDEMAELEALLDEYARLEVLDPSKLPGLAARIWSAIERANLQADLDIHERPEDVGKLVEHIDGYLCEVKDIQVKDGLHVLGHAPRGDQLRGLVSAMLRLGSGDVPGLRRAVGAAFGLDEPALVAAGGAPIERAPAASWSASAGRAPARATSSIASRTRTWRCSTRSPPATGRRARRRRCVAEVLGLADAGVERALRFACDEVVPRILRTPDELTGVVRALRGRHIASGPSGAPTRGRIDVLPTGRNFYSVDPRALPSELSWEVGQRLADALLDRHRARDRGAAADGRPRRLGHRRDAHAGRRRGRDPRAARCAADLASGVKARDGHRGRAARRARPSAHRRDRPHLRLLPRRLPAPRAAARRRGRRGRLARGVRRGQLRRRARARRRRAAGRGDRRRSGLAARHHADLRLQARAPTGPGCCSCSTRATGATTTTSPPSTRRGAATPTAAAWTARRPRTRCATPTPASRWRSRTSTRASTTSSTPTTTTSTTVA